MMRHEKREDSSGNEKTTEPGPRSTRRSPWRHLHAESRNFVSIYVASGLPDCAEAESVLRGFPLGHCSQSWDSGFLSFVDKHLQQLHVEPVSDSSFALEVRERNVA